MELSSGGNVSESLEVKEEENCEDETENQITVPPLTIFSKGRTLIIGPDIEHALDIGELLTEKGLSCTLCVPTNENSELSISRTGALDVIEGDSVSVSGSFGGFTITAAAGGDQKKLPALFGNEVGFFDLVLDLQSTPSYRGKQLPVGYFAPGDDEILIDEALAELPEMKGRFTRPQFTLLNENRCLHGRSQKHDCRRCLEICPLDAISSDGRRIAFDPYLCQGCGGCALVCPADAIRMQSPTQEEILSALAARLSEANVLEDSPPDLILYDRNIENKTLRTMIAATGGSPVFFEVDEISRIGLEVLLAALTNGAGSVTLICGQEKPAPISQALQRQVELGKTILQGLHYPTDLLRFIIHQAERMEPEPYILPDKTGSEGPARLLIPPASFPFGHDKRTLTCLAASHLFKVSGAHQSSIPLPDDAPYGAVVIDADSCSLCMACAGSCPPEALRADGDAPRISLVESRCHQCGLCMTACPEDAIRLQPRLLCDFAAADSPVVAREVEPFNCIECGEPFASQAMINRMQEKLSGHWMYSSDRQIRRLRMCRTCRTQDALTAGDFR